MNQIDLIRAEIERRKEIYENTVDFARSTGQDECASININLANLCENFLSFLSTLQEQPEGTPNWYSNPLEEQLACDDLEKEAVSYCFDNGLNLSPRVATDFARHFAQWQKEQDEKMLTVEYLKGVEWGKQDTKEQMTKEEVGWNQDVLKDLKKAGKPWNEAELWVKEYANKENGFDEASAKVGYATGYQVRERQMLKEAVPFYEILKVVPPGPERDKVRIIIVKED